jgi:hypothetical protein
MRGEEVEVEREMVVGNNETHPTQLGAEAATPN